MWSDNETADDLLGFQVHADLIRSVVTDAKMLPVTIGIFGDWGGGKTSIMKMLERDLDPEHWAEGSSERLNYEKAAVIYFNGWQFEGYDYAKAAILSSVLLSLGDHKRFGPKVRDKALDLLKSVEWMRVARFRFKHIALPAAAAFATGGAAAIPAVLGVATGLSQAKGSEKPESEEKGEGGWFKSKENEHAIDVRTFRERFEKMLKDSDIDKLIILIPGAAEKLNAVLVKVPLDSANPAVGMDILTLTKGKPELQSVLQPALARIGKSKERIGIAVSGKGGKK